jgi:Lysylphosphatidylglycerol synthase TM region
MSGQAGRESPLAWVWLALAATAFAVVTWFCWQGRLGLPAIGLLLVSTVLFGLGRRQVRLPSRASVDLVAKTVFTVVGIIALLRHPIDVGEGARLPIYDAIKQYLPFVDLRVFILFGLLAMLIKFVGVIFSAYAWHLLLVGQRIRYPFWQSIMTAFLIGRFIGTFLPSTIGLDGYTLYEAGRYSNQWSRAVTAKALEKFIGLAGLFLGMVLTLPFGYQVIVDVTSHLDRPHAAPLLAAAIALVGGGVSAAVVLILVWPVLLTRLLQLGGRLLPGGIRAQVDTLGRAAGAYRGQVGLLFAVLFSKFVTHFTTAVVYFFTALAIGVAGARFWPIVFGSTIQIMATVLSPTIAGEGAREAFQALLLSKHLGGVAQAVLSGALGFIAAEAGTLWGGAFLWVRTPGWRPRFTLVDGKQVDYAWIDDSEPSRLAAAKVAAATAGR